MSQQKNLRKRDNKRLMKIFNLYYNQMIRTHQIRVHLKERRTPIAGDEAYGTAEWNKKLARSDNIHRPLLHAYETEFTHPFTGMYSSSLMTVRHEIFTPYQF